MAALAESADDQRRELKQILHSLRCYDRDQRGASAGCADAVCVEMCELIRHMKKCVRGAACVDECVDARALLHHWNTCDHGQTKHDGDVAPYVKVCPVCGPLRRPGLLSSLRRLFSSNSSTDHRIVPAPAELQKAADRASASLWEHSRLCRDSTCKQTDCREMKRAARHEMACLLKFPQCPLCARLHLLLKEHIKQHDGRNCKMPSCVVFFKRLNEESSSSSSSSSSDEEEESLGAESSESGSSSSSSDEEEAARRAKRGQLKKARRVARARLEREKKIRESAMFD